MFIGEALTFATFNVIVAPGQAAATLEVALIVSGNETVAINSLRAVSHNPFDSAIQNEVVVLIAEA